MTLQVDDEDRASRLLELQSRVRAATEGGQTLDSSILRALGCFEMISDRITGTECINKLADRTYSHPAPISSSIDAALGLVERVLPGWNYQIMQQRGDHTPFFLARIATVTDDDVTGFDAVNDHGAPLAILDALLSALIAQSEASLRAVPAKSES